MIKAQLITIGTEIVAGEVVNTNAAWVSLRLEEMGVRVYSHLSVRDQRQEIFAALTHSREYDLVIVTGGLGPTSDDITRECLAEFSGQTLEFDERAWQEIQAFYLQRGLKIREAIRHQCYFPLNSERLPNPVGTALGFHLRVGGKPYFVLPGPPRELEGMWAAEVAPRLRQSLTPSTMQWRHWTCLGAPESEIAELVEAQIVGQNLEVGYRATVPYVKVKIFIDPSDPLHHAVGEKIDHALGPFVVVRGAGDLAAEFLSLWPSPSLLVIDHLLGAGFAERLLGAQDPAAQLKLNLISLQESVAPLPTEFNLRVTGEGDELRTELRLKERVLVDVKQVLPYKVALDSARGKRSATEWVLWNCVKCLRAFKAQSST